MVIMKIDESVSNHPSKNDEKLLMYHTYGIRNLSSCASETVDMGRMHLLTSDRAETGRFV